MKRRDIDQALDRLDKDDYKNYRIRYQYCTLSRLFTAYTTQPITGVLTGAGRTEQQVKESIHAAIDLYEEEWGALAYA